jgi:hypothetical protein
MSDGMGSVTQINDMASRSVLTVTVTSGEICRTKSYQEFVGWGGISHTNDIWPH